jgi:hypothetical protein
MKINHGLVSSGVDITMFRQTQLFILSMVAYYGYILTKIDDLVPCAPLKNPVSDPSGFYYRILGNYYIYITNDIYIYT